LQTPNAHKFQFTGSFAADCLNDKASSHEAVDRVIGSVKSCAKRIALGEHSEKTATHSNKLASVFHAQYEHADDKGRGNTGYPD
jgi:hypothetical protein